MPLNKETKPNLKVYNIEEQESLTPPKKKKSKKIMGCPGYDTKLHLVVRL